MSSSIRRGSRGRVFACSASCHVRPRPLGVTRRGRPRPPHPDAAGRRRPDVVHRPRQGHRPVHLGGAPAGQAAGAARPDHGVRRHDRPRPARPAADRVHLDPADRPLAARRLPRAAARHHRDRVAAGRWRATSPTSSRSGSATPADLEDLLARIRAAANVSTRTTIVLSTPYESRPVGMTGASVVLTAGPGWTTVRNGRRRLLGQRRVGAPRRAAARRGRPRGVRSGVAGGVGDLAGAGRAAASSSARSRRRPGRVSSSTSSSSSPRPSGTPPRRSRGRARAGSRAGAPARARPSSRPQRAPSRRCASRTAPPGSRGGDGVVGPPGLVDQRRQRRGQLGRRQVVPERRARRPRRPPGRARSRSAAGAARGRSPSSPSR